MIMILFLYLFYENILVRVKLFSWQGQKAISDRYQENGFGEIGNQPSITL